MMRCLSESWSGDRDQHRGHGMVSGGRDPDAGCVMSHSKWAAHRRSRLPVGYLIGVAALAGAAASIYVLATNVLASDPDPGRGIGLSMIPPPPSLDQTGPDGADRQLLDRCLEELAAGDELIAVAQTG